MLRIIKIVTSKTYVQKALILNGFFMLAQPPGERERTIITFLLLLSGQTTFNPYVVFYYVSINFICD